DALLENLPSDIWQSLSEGEKQRTVRVAQGGTPLFVVVASFDITSFDEEFFRLREALAQTGEVIATSPTVDPEHSDRVNFRVVYASAAPSADLQNCVAGCAAEFTKLERPETSYTFTGELQTERATANAGSASALANFVRTDLAKLDHLIST